MDEQTRKLLGTMREMVKRGVDADYSEFMVEKLTPEELAASTAEELAGRLAEKVPAKFKGEASGGGDDYWRRFQQRIEEERARRESWTSGKSAKEKLNMIPRSDR